MAEVGSYRFWSADEFPLFEIPVEDSFKPAIRALFRHDLGELFLDVSLVPEPDGPQGLESISVRAGDNTIGYLPAERAGVWAGPVRRVIASGLLPSTRAKVFTVGHSGGDRLNFLARIQIGLRDVADALPVNDPPAFPYTMLPHSSFTKVGQVDGHLQDVLPLVAQNRRGMYFATLHERKPFGGSGKSIVEVRIEQRCVGELTPAMSQKYLPMIQHLRERGLVGACRAELRGSSVSAEIRIYGAKATEVGESFLNGDPIVLPRLSPRLKNPLDYDLTNLADYLEPRERTIFGNSTREADQTPSTIRIPSKGPVRIEAIAEGAQAAIRAAAAGRDVVLFQSARSLVLDLVSGVGGLAAEVRRMPDGATAEKLSERFSASTGSEMAKAAIALLRLADILEFDLAKRIGRKINSTFLLVPVAAASAADLEGFLEREHDRNVGEPPVELMQMLDELFDRCQSWISIARAADAGGAAITVLESQPDCLCALFEATRDHQIAAYDIELKRLYNPFGSVSVRVLLGGEVVIPYATSQLIDDVVRNPAWPEPGAPFVIIERDDPGKGERYIQTYLNDDGSYTLEYRDGSSDQHYGYETTDAALVSAAMWSWIVEDYERMRNIVSWERQDPNT